MKLTKQKLEQLIMEEYKKFKTMSQKIFDKRRKQHGDELFRAVGDEDQPINYPELHDKLGTLYSADPESKTQALDLADTLDEPIDRKFSGMKTIPFPTDKFTHGKESGLRLHSGGGSSDSIIYKMHETAKEFLDFLDQTGGYVSDAAFYNEDYIKSFGHVHGKEAEQLLRTYIKHTDLEGTRYDDNIDIEYDMRWDKYNK